MIYPSYTTFRKYTAINEAFLLRNKHLQNLNELKALRDLLLYTNHRKALFGDLEETIIDYTSNIMFFQKMCEELEECILHAYRKISKLRTKRIADHIYFEKNILTIMCSFLESN